MPLRGATEDENEGRNPGAPSACSASRWDAAGAFRTPVRRLFEPERLRAEGFGGAASRGA